MDHCQVVGYYICEIKDAMEWLNGIGKQVLSVSGCIGDQHPKWECFLGGWCKGESQEYQKSLRMNDEQYREFTETANRLFDAKRMDVDSRFLKLSDARYVHKRFCSAIPCRVVSISTLPEYMEELAEEWEGDGYGLTSGETDGGLWIGSDILGWDMSGFHSFLCNSLQDGLPAARFNDIGLLENDFHEVIRYAKQIEGLGEPVKWIPCKVGAHE